VAERRIAKGPEIHEIDIGGIENTRTHVGSIPMSGPSIRCALARADTQTGRPLRLDTGYHPTKSFRFPPEYPEIPEICTCPCPDRQRPCRPMLLQSNRLISTKYPYQAEWENCSLLENSSTHILSYPSRIAVVSIK